MNRRTLLKSVPLALITPSLLLAGNKNTPQWTSLKQQLPKIGQKVILKPLVVKKDEEDCDIVAYNFEVTEV